MTELNNIARKILENGKGILAADESTGTMTKRLDGVKVPSTAENRLLFRETLFSASSMTECIGGVILYDETIKQESSKKNKVPELISKMGSIPGIKVDTGAKVLAGSPDEKITEGLDGLRDRLKEYYSSVQNSQNGEGFIVYLKIIQVNFQYMLMLMHWQDTLH